ncbi:hypothetical protein Tco_1165834 [Tanacetum coccineum]
MRLKTDIKPKEATFQVVLEALALTPFYQTFLITAEVPAIYMQEFWATVSVHKLSIRFTISKKKVSLDVDIFIEILQFCPKIPGQEFEDLPLEHNILSFIRDLGHSRDIIHLSDVSVDCLHQPWRAFATIINKCLSGKETGMDKINPLGYELTNQEMLESKAYKTYYAFAYGGKTLKPKYVQKKVDSDTSPKQNPVQATKEEDKDDENDSKDKSDGNDDDDANDDNNQEGDDTNDDDKEDYMIVLKEYYEVTKELYDDVNVNLGNEDTDMTNADQVRDTQKADKPVQSSSVSSDFTSKLLNLENPSPADNRIASLLDTIVRHATAVPKIISIFSTTIPPPPLFFNPLLQQATPTLTPTTSEATTLFNSLLDFYYVFKFNERVTNLEKDMSKIKQVDQYAQALSAIPAIKRGGKPKSHLRADYKKKLYDALVESYNTDKDLFNTYGEVFTLKRSQEESDKDRYPSAGSDQGTKRRTSRKEAESSKDSRSKEKKSSSTSKDTSQSQHKSSGKSAHAEEQSHTVNDLGVQQDQEFDIGNNDEQPPDKEVSKEDWFNVGK